MLKVLLLFILLIAGIVLGPMLAGHQGYVLIQTDNYNIETSVTGLTIILILGVVVLFAIEWILRRIFPSVFLVIVAPVKGAYAGDREYAARRLCVNRAIRNTVLHLFGATFLGKPARLGNQSAPLAEE